MPATTKTVAEKPTFSNFGTAASQEAFVPVVKRHPYETSRFSCVQLKEGAVSRLAMALDSRLEGWRHRPLEAESFPYLFVWTSATRRSDSPQTDSEVSRSFVRTPQPAGVLEAGYGFGGRDLRGVANR
jgi:hypothetical protein